jgi:hypothetical protein
MSSYVVKESMMPNRSAIYNCSISNYLKTLVIGAPYYR